MYWHTYGIQEPQQCTSRGAGVVLLQLKPPPALFLILLKNSIIHKNIEHYRFVTFKTCMRTF